MATSANPDDRVLPSTRVVSAFIAPFLVLAFAVLVPQPSDTGRLFAWEIKSAMSAMVLGSVYLGGAYFFLRAAFAARWHTIAGGFPPVATFAGLMGITTVLHWNRFIHGNLAFWLWVGLYFTTPFVVIAVFFHNRGERLPQTGNELLIPRGVAWVMVVSSAMALLVSGVLYLLPHEAIRLWPWRLTPLTARMLGRSSP
jgi:hypothetical protein